MLPKAYSRLANRVPDRRHYRGPPPLRITLEEFFIGCIIVGVIFIVVGYFTPQLGFISTVLRVLGIMLIGLALILTLAFLLFRFMFRREVTRKFRERGV